MVHPLLKPGIGAIGSAVIVAIIIWFMTDLDGIARIWTTGLSFVVAYLTFNATRTYLDLD